MMLEQLVYEVGPGVLLLVGAAIAIYIGSRAAIDAVVTGREDQFVRRGVGHFVPGAMVIIYAMIVLGPSVALGMLFSLSVATLTIATGGAIASSGTAVVGSALGGKLWSWALPVAVLVLLAGFQGKLDWTHAAVLCGQGAVTLLALSRCHPEMENDSTVTSRSKVHARSTKVRIFEIVFSLVLVGLGAWSMVRGVVDSAGHFSVQVTMIASTMAAPLLALPVLGSAMALGHRSRANEAISSNVVTVILNFCVLLPILIGIHYGMQLHPLGEKTPVEWTNLVYPISIWRVDAVVLVASGLFLVPFGLGKWPMRHVEGYIFLLIYVGYYRLLVQAGR